MNRSIVRPIYAALKSLVTSVEFNKLCRKWGTALVNIASAVKLLAKFIESFKQYHLPLARKSDLLANLKAKASDTLTIASSLK